MDMTKTTVLRRRRRRNEYLALGALVIICFAVAAFGAQFAPGTWYGHIDKPPWTPPNALFGPVWTLLYLLMAVAAWLVWRHRQHRLRVAALTAFAVQLVLNGLWSWIFFGAHEIGWALLDLAALWVALAVTVALFFRISTWAGTLLVPYLAWISFALALNLEIWRLN